MGTNTSGKCKKTELSLIGTLLSVAKNTWHQYKNEKKEIHQRKKSRIKKTVGNGLSYCSIFFMKSEKLGSYSPKP